MSPPKPRDAVLKCSPYQQGKSELPDVATPIKLSSNESPHGPSASAIAAFNAAADELNRYPDGSQSSLRNAIAKQFGLNANGIFCGNGSDELMSLLVRTYVGPGDEILMPEGHFVMCPIYANTQDAEIVIAPDKDYVIDVDAMLARITPKTRMVIIANPNPPAGTYLSDAEVRRLHAGIPEDVMFLIDSAYAEYVDRDDYDPGAKLVDEANNVVMTRTFSKMYALAALRVGWCYCPEDVAAFVHRIRSPFNVNSAALAAAEGALRDQPFVVRERERVAGWMARIQTELTDLGLYVVPSVTNFYLIDFNDMRDRSAAAAAASLEARGIIPRPVSTQSKDDVLRITIGSDSENEAVLAALSEYLHNNAA